LALVLYIAVTFTKMVGYNMKRPSKKILETVLVFSLNSWGQMVKVFMDCILENTHFLFTKCIIYCATVAENFICCFFIKETIKFK